MYKNTVASSYISYSSHMGKKFLFLYLKTGWGHLSAARALSQYYQNHYNDDIQISMRDGREHFPILKLLLEEWYTKIQSHGKPLYEFIYACNKFYICAKTNQLLIAQYMEQDMLKLIHEECPDHIVIFHFFLTKPVKDAVKKLWDTLWKKIRITVIVTDPFTAPILWFLEKDMEYVVYSEQVKHTAQEQWVAADKITVLSTIIHERFNHRPDQSQVHTIKLSRGIPTDKTVVLLGWGGDGMPRGEEILEEMIKKLHNVHILMVCGKNEELYKKAVKIVEHHSATHVQLYPFIDFMYDLMAAADIVVTKAGPAAIMEVLSLWKIPILNSYLREQEKWNMEFVVNNKIGMYEENIWNLVAHLEHMLSWWLSEYQANLARIPIKNGVADIAAYLLSIPAGTSHL